VQLLRQEKFNFKKDAEEHELNCPERKDSSMTRWTSGNESGEQSRKLRLLKPRDREPDGHAERK
jgi:hypothetical protein